MQDVWVQILSQVPTKFGGVTCVAGLRNENTGAYHHFKLAPGGGGLTVTLDKRLRTHIRDPQVAVSVVKRLDQIVQGK